MPATRQVSRSDSALARRHLRPAIWAARVALVLMFPVSIGPPYALSRGVPPASRINRRCAKRASVPTPPAALRRLAALSKDWAGRYGRLVPAFFTGMSISASAHRGLRLPRVAWGDGTATAALRALEGAAPPGAGDGRVPRFRARRRPAAGARAARYSPGLRRGARGADAGWRAGSGALV